MNKLTITAEEIRTASTRAPIVKDPEQSFRKVGFVEVTGAMSEKELQTALRNCQDKAQRSYFFKAIMEYRLHIMICETVACSLDGYKREGIDGWLSNRIKKDSEDLISFVPGSSSSNLYPPSCVTFTPDGRNRYGEPQDQYVNREPLCIYHVKTPAGLREECSKLAEVKKTALLNLEKSLLSIEKLNTLKAELKEKIEAAKNNYLEEVKKICGTGFCGIPGLSDRE